MSPTPLPYAIPKVGRRASDRKVLEEWYARHDADVASAGELRGITPLRAQPSATASAYATRAVARPERRATSVTSPAAG
jgi:hypothetical protein